MNNVEFSLILDELNYDYEINDDILTINHDGNLVFKDLASITGKVVFNNFGSIWFESLTNIVNVSFRNFGGVFFRLLSEVSNIDFSNSGSVCFKSLKRISNVKFNNNGVNFEVLEKLGRNVIFNNKTCVNFYELTELSKDVKFNNDVYIRFRKITNVSGVDFSSCGDLRFDSRVEINEDVVFKKQCKFIVQKKFAKHFKNNNLNKYNFCNATLVENDTDDSLDKLHKKLGITRRPVDVMPSLPI